MGSTSSHSPSIGDEWRATLVYFTKANPNRNSSTTHTAKHEGLIEKVGGFCESNERIIKIHTYKVSKEGFSHEFVAFETDNFGWTIEKDIKGITMLKSDRLDDVLCWYKQVKRKGKVSKLESHDIGASLTVIQLIRWLHGKNELKIKYNIACSNCFGFATRITEFAKSEERPNSEGTMEPLLDYTHIDHSQDPTPRELEMIEMEDSPDTSINTSQHLTKSTSDVGSTY